MSIEKGFGKQFEQHLLGSTSKNLKLVALPPHWFTGNSIFIANRKITFSNPSLQKFFVDSQRTSQLEQAQIFSSSNPTQNSDSFRRHHHRLPAASGSDEKKLFNRNSHKTHKKCILCLQTNLFKPHAKTSKQNSSKSKKIFFEDCHEHLNKSLNHSSIQFLKCGSLSRKLLGHNSKQPYLLTIRQKSSSIKKPKDPVFPYRFPPRNQGFGETNKIRYSPKKII